ncbi:MAG TPA: hypothetical protein VMV74_07495 [Bacteroidales bacterium]|nr:hypothetical protein [Bacteroidales bacterium]
MTKGFLNKELPVFAFFLLLSFIFWYLNELSKELEATIHYPVRYINPPKGRILTGVLPKKIGMELRGPGYTILKIKLSGSKAPVVIDFSKMSPKKIPGKTPSYYLVTSGLIEGFSKQLHADFEILAIQPDTIFFGYDRLVTRKMAVLPDIDVEASTSNMVIVVPDPDSIFVTGPEHVIDTVSGIRTRHRSFKRLNENFRTTVALDCPEYLEVTQKRIALEVSVIGRPSLLFDLKNHKGN